jgi:integrase
VLERFREAHGHYTLADLPKHFIVALLDSMSPHPARTLLRTLRHFIAWCVEHRLMKSDPTLGIRVGVPKSDGFHTWSEDEIAQFEAAHPIGSQARLALALGLYTGQRRADVVRMGRQHVRDGVLTIRQQKTGITLTIPVHAELATIIAATPTGDLTFLATPRRKGYGPNRFTEQFRRWCDAASLPEHCVFHGLRKAACRRLADARCTVHEIAAVSGHKSLSEVQRYTQAADQARLARAALERIGNESVKRVPPKVSKPLKRLVKNGG